MNRPQSCIFGALAFFTTATPGLALAEEGRNFADEARLFYRAVACSDDSPLPAGLHAETVDAHCASLQEKIDRFRKRYVKRATPFIARWRPAGLPTRVVYPFGGGDLVSALVTYPDLTEVTTISLENAGDPRRLAGANDEDLKQGLALYNEVVGALLKNHDSSSENLRRMERGPIPGQLSFFMLALVVHDFEPLSLKFFRLEEDGSIHYYSQKEIDDLDSTQATKLARKWVNTDYSLAFRNMELTFRRRGAGPDTPVRVHRHIAFNLDNEHFGDSALQKHLLAKGEIAAMTKAASYLLWSQSFSKIRAYLLKNMAFMVSDSTGILPKHARRAGFVQIPFGAFTGAYLDYASESGNEELRELWETSRKRGLPFRYGYPDVDGNFHMLITRPRPKRKPRRHKPATTAPAGDVGRPKPASYDD